MVINNLHIQRKAVLQTTYNNLGILCISAFKENSIDCLSIMDFLYEIIEYFVVRLISDINLDNC